LVSVEIRLGSRLLQRQFRLEHAGGPSPQVVPVFPSSMHWLNQPDGNLKSGSVVGLEVSFFPWSWAPEKPFSYILRVFHGPSLRHILDLSNDLSTLTHSQEDRRWERAQVAGAAGAAPGRNTTPGSDPMNTVRKSGTANLRLRRADEGI
uniref:SHR-BD domain-containing protein n=1 Tax=Schistocephalus solidus TaxID=70667 RepID=A0A183S990_SCHSO